jgi:hypothetical protein
MYAKPQRSFFNAAVRCTATVQGMGHSLDSVVGYSSHYYLHKDMHKQCNRRYSSATFKNLPHFDVYPAAYAYLENNVDYL